MCVWFAAWKQFATSLQWGCEPSQATATNGCLSLVAVRNGDAWTSKFIHWDDYNSRVGRVTMLDEYQRVCYQIPAEKQHLAFVDDADNTKWIIKNTTVRMVKARGSLRSSMHTNAVRLSRFFDLAIEVAEAQ